MRPRPIPTGTDAATNASALVGQPPTPAKPACKPAARPLQRRTVLVSVGGLLLAPPMDLTQAIRSELSLWGQEVQLYKRQLQEAVKEAAPWATQQQPQKTRPRPPINADLATLLLQLPLDAMQGSGGSSPQPILPGWSRSRYEADFAAIVKQELPYYQRAGACGSCGGDDVSDADWFDFQCYCQWKAIARQLPPGSRRVSYLANGMDMLHGGGLWDTEAPRPAIPAPVQPTGLPDSAAEPTGQASPALPTDGLEEPASSSRQQAMQANTSSSQASTATTDAPPAAAPPLEALQLRMGQLLLQHVQHSAALPADVKEVLESGSAALDSVRAGVRGLLEYFTQQGFVVHSGIEQLGISRDEFENHEVWATGEPALVKIWLERPATSRSQAALELEEGFSQDFIAATVVAYLASCGISTQGLKHYPSYSNPDLVALQCTIRLQPGRVLSSQEADTSEYEPFVLDLCPNGQPTGCY